MKIFNLAAMNAGLNKEGNLAEAIQNPIPLTAVLNDCFPSNTISSDEQDLSLPIMKGIAFVYVSPALCAQHAS